MDIKIFLGLLLFFCFGSVESGNQVPERFLPIQIERRMMKSPTLTKPFNANRHQQSKTKTARVATKKVQTIINQKKIQAAKNQIANKKIPGTTKKLISKKYQKPTSILPRASKRREPATKPTSASPTGLPNQVVLACIQHVNEDCLLRCYQLEQLVANARQKCDQLKANKYSRDAQLACYSAKEMAEVVFFIYKTNCLG